MPQIHILMATRNGAAFIDQQLQSLADQTHQDWCLWVSDDGSVDDTKTRVAAFGAKYPGRVKCLVDGPQRGVAANFLSLLAQEDLAGCWVAFADQDDVWLPQKLDRAVAMIVQQNSEFAVYGSRRTLTDANLRVIGQTRDYSGPFTFGNALVQNVLGGNSIVMSPKVTDLVRRSLPAAIQADVPFHDWWVYLIAAGAGAAILWDQDPSLLYRQHANNALGTAMRRRMARVIMLISGTYAGWNTANIDALSHNIALLTPQATAQLGQVIQWRAGSRLRRGAPQSVGLFHQNRLGNAVLRLLAYAGRV